MNYPNSVPEFRLLQSVNGSQKLQVRYVCEAQRYCSKWVDVPVVLDNN
jgi:hypothetical protein